MKYIVSFSGGKDSTAMLLHMLELGTYPIDEVINLDTGLEFPAMYEHIAKIKKVVEENGIKFTVLKADTTFEYLAFEHEYYSKKYKRICKGYGWARSKSRWCTGHLKTKVLEKYRRNIGEDFTEYIGIAYDEQRRLQRKTNQQKNHVHPLVDWKWTEADALKYCYDHGYDFGGLYKIFKRVSCWCCPLQSLAELHKLRNNFPDLWQKLKKWEQRTDVPFRSDYNIPMLEARFKLEDQRVKQGLTCQPRANDFRYALKDCLKDLPKTDTWGRI